MSDSSSKDPSETADPPECSTDNVPPIRWLTKIAYGVGHMYNDMCACMWFTYLLVYFVFVVQFPRDLAGIILLVGQIVDGVSTIFAGTVVNIIKVPYIEERYGKRKTWHLIGSILTFFSFPFIFLPCPGCSNAPVLSQLAYYLFLGVIFQFGWACVQVSHLALTPVLTSDIHQRSQLNTLRNCFQVLSNVAVYVITGVAIGLRDVNTATSSPEYAATFRNIVLIISGIGAVTTVCFHVGVSEKTAMVTSSELETSVEKKQTNWLKKMSFYKISLVFTSARLFLNLTQLYVPFYLKETLHLANINLAVVPLIMYLSGFIISFPVNYCNKFLGRSVTFVIGCIIGIAGCVWGYFGDGDVFKQYEVYVFGALIGIACSTIQIASLTMTSDMIGNRVKTGAFVYGVLSFMDKLANGLVGMGVQIGDPTDEDARLTEYYYRDVMAWVCGGAAVLGIIAVMTIFECRRDTERDSLTENMEEDAEENPSVVA